MEFFRPGFLGVVVGRVEVVNGFRFSSFRVHRYFFFGGRGGRFLLHGAFKYVF